MDTELIIFNEYCQKSHTDPTFIISLEEGGLIEIRTVDGERYLLASQLRELERYSHLYYDLSINIEGIDAIHHMLERMERLQQEVSFLRRQLRRFQTKDDFFRKNIDDKTNFIPHKLPFLRTMEKWNNERKANFNSPFLLIYGRYISLLIRLR